MLKFLTGQIKPELPAATSAATASAASAAGNGPSQKPLRASIAVPAYDNPLQDDLKRLGPNSVLAREANGEPAIPTDKKNKRKATPKKPKRVSGGSPSKRVKRQSKEPEKPIASVWTAEDFKRNLLRFDIELRRMVHNDMVVVLPKVQDTGARSKLCLEDPVRAMEKYGDANGPKRYFYHPDTRTPEQIRQHLLPVLEFTSYEALKQYVLAHLSESTVFNAITSAAATAASDSTQSAATPVSDASATSAAAESTESTDETDDSTTAAAAAVVAESDANASDEE
ncbi:MAG TPA: hypothetical protein VM260_00880 [Pirellula sp.]|nr:hypothetical protein [Pirellula sp.]